jgi:circadian clock protein KaiC
MAGQESTESEVSSIVDTWILLRDIELGGERNRGIYIQETKNGPLTKCRILITSNSVDIVDVYTDLSVLTGSARLSQK